MQHTLILVFLASSFAFAQTEGDHVFVTAHAIGGFQRMSGAPVQGAPYSATITNESIQTLADGNRIVQTSTGNTARDSQGRTRQDAPLPPIGNMAPADAPHLVFLQDPVAQVSYTLNLTDKTAMKGPAFYQSSISGAAGNATVQIRDVAGPFPMSMSAGQVSVAAGVAPPMPMQPQMIIAQKTMIGGGVEGQAQTEDLGTKTMEGVNVAGTRVTRTISAGQIGNDKPLNIVTEVWTSPELKTVVYSKRSDPRMGDQTFQLTNIMRAEPDPTLFVVPSDFKVIEGAEPIVYKTKGVPAQ
jgi:hypothetical protein